MTASLSRIALANNQFAVDLYRNFVSPNKPENVIFSPFSVLAALSMVNVGAQGATRDEIFSATKLNGIAGSDPTEVHHLFKHFYSNTGIRVGAGEANNSEPKHEFGRIKPYLSLANRVYLQDGIKIHAQFATTLLNSYKTSFGVAEFALDPKGAASGINRWVEDVTNGKIKDLFDDFDRQTKLVLASAIYLKAEWEDVFFAENTVKKQFLGARKNVTADFLEMSDDGSLIADFTADFDAKALLKSFVDKDIHMLVFLPNKKNGLANLEAKFSTSLFDVSRYAEPNVRISLPKFKINEDYSLKHELKKMGITKAFDDAADFSNIADIPLKISEVVHKSFIALDEKGVEAAAATGIKITALSVPPPRPHHDFVADHPFLFAIQHKRTGAVLFLGKVEDPTYD